MSKADTDVKDRVEIFRGEGITKRYKSKSGGFVLEPVDLSLGAGEIMAVVGENGAGKTTILEMVAGERSTTGGEMIYPHLEENGRDSAYEIRQKIVMLKQELPSWNGTLKNNLHFTAAIHGIKGEENEEWVDFIVKNLGLEKYLDATWKQISGGFRTRYSLARALVQRPNLLALDEPLANLDINTQLVFLNNLKELANNFVEPLAIFISSQHLHEIESISDKIIFLRDGETVYNGLMKDFESGRKENTFELVTDASEKDMRKLLKPLGVKGIEQAGDNYLVKVAVKIEAEAVLRALLDGGVKIALFRDISRSTRKLFRVEK